MSIDVIDLRSFYSSSLGEVARRVVHKIVRQRFSNCSGYSILGVGYATPYLEVFREEAVRVLAFMPAEQGVVNWPASGLSSSALVETNRDALAKFLHRPGARHPCARNHRTSARSPCRNLADFNARRAGRRRGAVPFGPLGAARPDAVRAWTALFARPIGRTAARKSVFADALVGSAVYSALPAPDVAARGRVCRRDRRWPLLAGWRRFDRRGNQALVPAGRGAQSLGLCGASAASPVLCPNRAGVSPGVTVSPMSATRTPQPIG